MAIMSIKGTKAIDKLSKKKKFKMWIFFKMQITIISKYKFMLIRKTEFEKWEETN